MSIFRPDGSKYFFLLIMKARYQEISRTGYPVSGDVT
jgi:hypothetical protein